MAIPFNMAAEAWFLAAPAGGCQKSFQPSLRPPSVRRIQEHQVPGPVQSGGHEILDLGPVEVGPLDLVGVDVGPIHLAQGDIQVKPFRTLDPSRLARWILRVPYSAQ